MQSQSAQSPRFASTFACVRDTMRHEGPLAFYKGSLVPLLTVTLSKGVLFTGFRTFVELLGGSTGTGATELSFERLLLAGGAAGLCNTIVSTPVETVKARVQLQARILARDLT
jgi:solute carrier family 25 carnitine/acylcarnitine transporter 20/29